MIALSPCKFVYNVSYLQLHVQVLHNQDHETELEQDSTGLKNAQIEMARRIIETRSIKQIPETKCFLVDSLTTKDTTYLVKIFQRYPAPALQCQTPVTTSWQLNLVHV